MKAWRAQRAAPCVAQRAAFGLRSCDGGRANGDCRSGMRRRNWGRPAERNHSAHLIAFRHSRPRARHQRGKPQHEPQRAVVDQPAVGRSRTLVNPSAASRESHPGVIGFGRLPLPLPPHVAHRNRSILESRFGLAPSCDDLKIRNDAVCGDSRLRRELVASSSRPIKRSHCRRRISACTQRRNRPLRLDCSRVSCMPRSIHNGEGSRHPGVIRAVVGEYSRRLRRHAERSLVIEVARVERYAVVSGHSVRLCASVDPGDWRANGDG